MQLQSEKSEQRQNKPKQLLTAGSSLPDAARAWLKQLPLRPKQPHLRSKFENISQAGAKSDAGPKQPSSLREHAEPKQPNSHRPPEANVWLLQSPLLSFDAFWKLFFAYVNELCDFIVCPDACCQSALARTEAAVVFDSYWHKLQTRDRNKQINQQ